MVHKGTNYMETQRLILRPFTMDDVESMFNNWASDDDVTRFITWDTHTDISVTEKVVGEYIERYNDPSYYHWIMETKEDKVAFGSIVVPRTNDAIESVEVGYCIGTAYWGKGYVAEAFKAVIDYLFDEVGVNRIAACHDVNNPASGKVMEKCGLKYEGTLRQSGKNKDGICDLAHYSIIKSDRK